MSLFPAYGLEDPASNAVAVAEPAAAVRWEAAPESELLASSDSDAEPAGVRAEVVVAGAGETDYYEDRRLDGGNLRVSTIYFPGRPQYNRDDLSHALGLRGAARARKRARRYWEARGEARGAAGEGGAPEEGERAAALRRALAERPQDEALWLQYIDYQEWAGGASAALVAAEAGAARLPRAPRLRARRLAALERALAPRDALQRLRDMLAQEKEPGARAALWARLVALLARDGGGGGGAGGAGAAAAAAARDLRRLPRAYPHLILTYGLVLRAAGLWETLVLLLELLLAMSAPPAAPAAPFPPPADAARAQAAEERLLDYEDKVINSGLPGGAVWARVERARGAAHWRPAAPAAPAAPADPQAAPEPADVAELLMPVADPDALLLLLVNALRLAKVPLLPGAGYVRAAAGAAGAGGGGEAGEALLAGVRAARRLPPAHAARPPPRAARCLVQMFVDPPHYFSDDYGYRSWVESLWDAALSSVGAVGAAGAAGGPRVALLCWRLRWLHSLLLLVNDDPECAAEAKRIRDSAQAALRRYGGAHPVPFAQFARLAGAAGAAGGAGGRRAALVALRAALQDAALPHHQLLYVARIVQEVFGGEGAEQRLCAEGAWALSAAVLRRAPPEDMSRAPPPALLQAAQDECERRCAELEAEMEQDEEDEGGELGGGAALAAALLPGEAEWAAARALLAAPARRRELLRRLLADAAAGEPRAGGARAARWREQQGAALLLRAGAAGGAAARALSALHPDNCLLALMSGGAPLWAPGAAWAAGAGAGAAGGGARVLGAAWPALLRAVASDWEPEAAGVLARVLRRLVEGGAGGAGAGQGAGALLWALRLEAEARAPAPRLQRVALAALDDQPHHKWLYVRAGALGAGGAALPDVLLERGLRLHALPDELRPLAAPAAPAAPAPTPHRDHDPTITT